MSAVRLQAIKPEIRRSLAEGLLACSDFQREDGERLAFGIAFHDFVALYWRRLQAIHEESDLTAVRGLASEAWARTPGLLQSRFDEFMGLAERFAETHLGNLATLTVVEHTEVLDVGFAVLTATMDRIDRLDAGDPDDDATWEQITDYKTEQGEMDHAYQIRDYVQKRFLNHPRLRRISFVVDPVRLGRPDEPIEFERGGLDEWWRVNLDGLRRRLDTPPGNPTGSAKCYECALRTTCGRALAEAREAPTTEAQADEQLAEHHRLDAGAEVRWAGLKHFYEGRDERVVAGEDVGFLETLEPSVEILVGPTEMRFYNAVSGRPQDAYLKVATPTSRAVVDQMLVLGLARSRYKPRQFKTRIHKELGRVARRKAAHAAEAASDG